MVLNSTCCCKWCLKLVNLNPVNTWRPCITVRNLLFIFSTTTRSGVLVTVGRKKKERKKEKERFPLPQMRGLAHEKDMSGKKLGARVCKVAFKHLPQHIQSFGTIGQHLKIPPFVHPNISLCGGRGGPCFFKGMESSYFCYHGPHAKFKNPRKTFENTPLCPPKYSIVRGVGGSQRFFLDWNPNIFLS